MGNQRKITKDLLEHTNVLCHGKIGKIKICHGKISQILKEVTIFPPANTMQCSQIYQASILQIRDGF